MTIRTGATRDASGDLAFRVGGLAVSIPAGEVLEVVRAPRITHVPLSPESLAGLMNFHGRVVPVLWLARLLRREGAADDAGFVVVLEGDEPTGLLVDEILRMDEAAGSGGDIRRLDLPALLKTSWNGSAVASSFARPLLRQAAPVAEAASRSLLGFTVSDQFYALPLGAIREVIALPEAIARMPHAGGVILGVVPLRDTTLPVASLAHLLGLPEPPAGGRGAVIVAEIGAWRVGLLADSVDKVLRVPESAIEDVPHLLRRREGDAEIDAIGRLGSDQRLISILSPRKLFGNEQVASAVADGGGEDGSMVEGPAEIATEQFIVLVLGPERFGLPIGAVDEIIELPASLTRLPNAPAFVAGVVNLRGRPLPVIDQRTRFRTAGAAPKTSRIVVVTVDQLQAGFIVDGVSQIVRVETSAIATAPTLPGEAAHVFDRVAALGDDGEMLLLIDPRELLNRAERDLLQPTDLQPMEMTPDRAAPP